MLNGKVMSGDIEVARVTNDRIEITNDQFAPLYFRKYSDIKEWLLSRAVDSQRHHPRLIKQILHLASDDEIGTVLAVNAASVTDNYWFCPDGETLIWDKIKFKENSFDRLALSGKADSLSFHSSRTPELTNIGSYEKCWKMIDGKWWMYKNGNDNEIFSELFICYLGKALGFPMAHYEYADGYIRTKDFTNGAEVNFESAESIVGDDEDYRLNFNVLMNFSQEIAKDYLRLIYLDTVCMNMDRHTKNYGLLRDTTTGRILSLAPNYDNNIALISRGYPKNTERNNDILIDLFRNLIGSNTQAAEMFRQIPIPYITKQMIDDCINAVPIEVDREKIKALILNGQARISECIR